MWMVLAGALGIDDAAASESSGWREAGLAARAERPDGDRKRGDGPARKVLGITTLALGSVSAAVGASIAAPQAVWFANGRRTGLFLVREGVVLAADSEAASELRRRRRAQNVGLGILAVGIGGIAVGSTLTTLEPDETGTGMVIRWSARW